MLKIIERANIDVERWDALVDSCGGTTILSLSTYLDAVSEGWCVLVDEHYTCGIALPYTTRLGVKKLYTPIFGRYIEVLGTFSDLDAVKQQIFSHFKVGSINFREESLGAGAEEYVYQEIDAIDLHQQAKRMIAKSLKSKYDFKKTDNITAIHRVMELELSRKVSKFRSHSNNVLKLIHALKAEDHLVVYGFYDQEEIVGGMIFIRYKDRILYLKGAAIPDARNSGIMYACMNHVIETKLGKGFIFDFGGSRVEGVRRFNLNFGGKDVVYYHYEWNNAPLWWNSIRFLRTFEKKNSFQSSKTKSLV